MKKIYKKPTVTVGTSAYNEEQNIAHMLSSVLSQVAEVYELREVIVVSDGSSDKTVEIARSMGDPRVIVVEDGKRKGQAARINELYKMFTSDIFVMIDADMVMKDDHALENMVKEFISDPSMSFVMGSTEPVGAETFFERAINNYWKARLALNAQYSLLDRAYGSHAFLGYTRSFAKSIRIPTDTMNPDAFAYFTAVTTGKRTKFTPHASVLFRSPQSIQEYTSQGTRHLYGGVQLAGIFGKEEVAKGFYVSPEAAFAIARWQFLKSPVGYLVLKLAYMCCSIKSRLDKKNMTTVWAHISSSKHVI